MFKEFLKDERGQFSYVFILLIIFFTLIVIFAVVAPIMGNLSTHFYTANQPIVENTRDTIATIGDPTMRGIMEADINAQLDYQALNIETLTVLGTYGGIFIIIIVVLVFFLLARRNVEAGQVG